jgi:hypothetical protein
MNWDAIGAVGEIIGALAVLLTLIYLGGCRTYNSDAFVREYFASFLA